MSLKDRLDQADAEGWKPEPGDELLGKIIDLGQRTTEWGTYRVVTVEEEDGTCKAFHAYHTVAADMLAGAYPTIGDEIGIRYLGKVDAPKSQYGSYQGYKIIVEHPAGWSPPSIEDAAGQQDRESTESAGRGSQGAVSSSPDPDERIPFRWDGCPSYDESRAHASRR